MGTSVRDQLNSAKRDRTLTRVIRRFDSSRVHGYVLDIGPTFFLVALVSDRVWFDGFECLRIEDVTEARPDPHGGFMEKALAKRGQELGTAPSIDLTDLSTIVLSAGRASPIITIQHEADDPEVCWIGKLMAVHDHAIVLLEIDPDAQWHAEPTSYPLHTITRVAFDGQYEKALNLVGGKPPRQRKGWDAAE